MKERLVEDWLIRINERGYEIPFAQSLIAQGYRVLRCGHSPTEHGKDVLAIAPDDTVCGFQLKTGNLSQNDLLGHQTQIAMLVEARPIFPGLPANFTYQPFFVTTGEFKDPAISLVKEFNASWAHRKLPELKLINGRQLQRDFLSLSSDFWPIEAPAVREFRELYLVDGRGDFNIQSFAKFLHAILCDAKKQSDLERKISAANLFASYLLGEFYTVGDHWSIFQGWVVCAAQIAWAAAGGSLDRRHWATAFSLAKGGALQALESLANEVLTKNAFKTGERETDEYTRTRNTVTLGAACCWNIIQVLNGSPEAAHSAEKISQLLNDFLTRNRFFLWGEGAVPMFACMIWFLETVGRRTEATSMLLSLIDEIAHNNRRGSRTAVLDPYLTPDEALTRLFTLATEGPAPPEVVESYSLFPLIGLAVRRNLRNELDGMWKEISNVDLTWFSPNDPADLLLWHCEKGSEQGWRFDQPQSWKDLKEIAFRDDQQTLPEILRRDVTFALAFILTFRHRLLVRLFKHVDSGLEAVRSKARQAPVASA